MPRKKPPETPPNPSDPVLPAVNPVIEDHLRPDEGLPFPIVAIGGSAGGLEAFGELLRALPAETGMAFVVVQHLHATHESLLSDILARATRMPVAQVTVETPVKPDHVYVIAPGKDMAYGKGHLRVSARTETRGQHRSVDTFMRSLAEEHGHRAIGVILSGTGNDGVLGIQEIKAAGGVTFAQDITAEHAGMPRSAIATGAIDLVLPPAEIGVELGRIARHPYVRQDPKHDTLLQDAAFQRVLGTLRHYTGVDFGGYKRNTITRRIKRRLLLHKVEGLPEYVRLLQSQPTEVEALFQDLLINVTSFFRDAEAYDALKETVFPKLAEERGRHDPVRIWALGCSTGEEAYSLAIAFTEFAEDAGLRVTAQIFATDLNGVGIEKARSGIYSKGIAQDVSPERLRRFFVDIDGTYRVSKTIRDMCVFARQNVLADPPFSRLDLVACRNMLIYLDPQQQQRVIPLLHFALRREGYLWLGNSETIGTYRELFEPIDIHHKLYQKRAGAAPSVRVPLRRETPLDAGAVFPPPQREPRLDPLREVDRFLLERFAPPAVFVDTNMDVVQFRGDTSPFIAPSPGKASLSLPRLLRDGLAVPVRGALERARQEGIPVTEKALRVRANGGWLEVDVEVFPLRPHDGNSAGYLVLFQEPAANLEARARQLYADAQATSARIPTPGSDAEEITRLTRELTAAKSYLQSVIEQQEAANEELQSANEEVQSANEELQSINEELETSKEEIQSSNEELATVNDELQNRNVQLSESTNDLVNLLASVNVAIVMLGRDLRIRRFTPAAEKLFNLTAGDVGRPLGDIMFHLITPEFERLLLEVIETVAGFEREVQDRDGTWYSLRVRPYRTLDNRIDGAVIMLVDIDQLKRADTALREVDVRRDEFLAALAHELRNPLAGISNSARIIEGGEAADGPHAREILHRQLQNMTRMIEDLLDVTRMKQGKMLLRLEAVDLVAVVKQAIELTAHQRAAAGVQLAVTHATDSVWVRGDPMRLGQVISNLLDNAAKFSSRGSQIDVSLEVQGPHGRRIAVLRVKDSGTGIEADVMPHIFDRYVQARAGSPAMRGGIGMGLTLARELVKLHEGTIEASSPGVGLGSEFVVRLPAADAPGGARSSARAVARKQPAHASRRIVVVDDNLDSAESMRMMLRLEGHEVQVVHEGVGAIDAARDMQAQVVVLDIGLPDIDGYEVARQMRSSSAFDDTLVVAVTGWGRVQDVAKAREAGIDEHLTKPVDPDRLNALIAAGRKR